MVLIAGLLSACSSVSTPSNEGMRYASAPGTATAGPQFVTPARAEMGLPAPSYSTAPTQEYRLGPLDTLNVLVFQVPELSGDFQVGSDGSLGLPLIGSIRAAGRTVQDVQKEITAKLSASYLQQPQVTVKVTGFNSQKVTVDGAVAKPGIFPVSQGGGTLLDFIAQAGGMPRQADSSNVVVFRDIGGKKMVARFNVADIRNGKASDPTIYGGDRIVVPVSGVRSAWADFLQAVPAASFVARVGGI
jgi:polysaccharide export outer membrane protein